MNLVWDFIYWQGYLKIIGLIVLVAAAIAWSVYRHYHPKLKDEYKESPIFKKYLGNLK